MNIGMHKHKDIPVICASYRYHLRDPCLELRTGEVNGSGSGNIL